ARQPSSAMDSYYRLSSARSARHPGRPSEVPVHGLALARMEVHHPVLPCQFQGTFNICVRLGDEEPSFGVRVRKGVLSTLRRWWRGLAHSHSHQELLRFGRQGVRNAIDEGLDGG